MRLSYGVTGFYNDKEPPQMDQKNFKQLCYRFATQNHGKLVDIHTHYPANFYDAQLEMTDTLIYILLNKHYPYLAFASTVEFGNIHFIDNSILAEYFSPFYQVLNTNELNTTADSTFLKKTELNDAELKQIAYWKPETVGQIIFNHWD
ncbi:MAG TPA: hypothetical protein VKZ77_02860 [Bacillaceae bacterium]|nr:hypothetical protein [Bacillaceae bacterium]